MLKWGALSALVQTRAAPLDVWRDEIETQLSISRGKFILTGKSVETQNIFTPMLRKSNTENYKGAYLWNV